MQETDINLPDVVAELTAHSDRYEEAMLKQDVPVLIEYFWESPLALRFGVAEELYGSEAITAFRNTRKANFTDRTVLRRDVLAMGHDVGVVTLEFTVVVFGKLKHGRQSQVWMRINGTWRVVSAHVSHKVVPSAGKAADYTDAAAALLAQPVPAAYRESVVKNLDIISRVAQPLMAFELPESVEPAPEFKP